MNKSLVYTPHPVCICTDLVDLMKFYIECRRAEAKTIGLYHSSFLASWTFCDANRE